MYDEFVDPFYAQEADEEEELDAADLDEEELDEDADEEDFDPIEEDK